MLQERNFKRTQVNQNWLFERFNSKYNRLWEQFTDVGLLIIQIVAGFIFALLAFDSSPFIFQMALVLVVIILSFLCSLLSFVHMERLKTKNYLNKLLFK